MDRCSVYLLSLIVGCLSLSCTKEPARPNIILIMADDLGWGDVGFNGNDVIQTPHLDSLAAAGIVFERFYSASAVCSAVRPKNVRG